MRAWLGLVASAALCGQWLAGAAHAEPLPLPVRAKLAATLEADRVATRTAGIAATITRGGEAVWQSARGLSVVAAGAPFRRTTVASVGSVSKMFTATIVMRMAEDGLLSIDSPIAPYVPAYIPATGEVTIRDLLHMRSGYADIENLPAYIAASEDPNHVWTRKELFQPITPPHFTPGSQFEYSNVNYLLLTQIIDAVYPGGTAAAFRTYIAAPAGIEHQVSFARRTSFAANFAHGYQIDGDAVRDVSLGATRMGVNASVWGTMWGDGGIAGTATGLARFIDALFAGRIVQPATLAAMQAGSEVDYGLGMEQFPINGHVWYGHGGAFNGYTAFLIHDPDRDVTLAIVANTLNTDGSQVAIPFDLVAVYDAAEAAARPAAAR